MKFTESVFKAYDIRGKVPDELTPELARAVGRTLAGFLPPGQVAVGRDMRPDSAKLAEALISGLTRQSREVVDLGRITSDMIYFAVGKYKYAAGAMITASHNPGQYNGIKLTGKGVVPIGEDTGLNTIKKAIAKDNFQKPGQRGSIQNRNVLGEWVSHALTFAPKLKALKVGIDVGNGMAGILVPELEKKTPLQISGLYLKLDGTFPNHPANPLETKNLKDIIKLVKQDNLDCGIAFDGDGDRAFLVDETGQVLNGSVLGALLITKFLEDNPGATVLYNAICSRIVPETIERLGGKAVRTRVGHSFIKADMRKHKAVFACEHSGHFYFRDNYNADSGLIAALAAMDIISASGKKLSELVADFRDQYYDSGEINFEVKNKQAVMTAIAKKFTDGKQDLLDGLTVNYPDWWFNVRPSNTEPYLRLNIEANTHTLLEEKLAEITNLIKTLDV